VAATAQELINRTRRYVADWPVQGTTTASLSASATTVTIAPGPKPVAVGDVVEIDLEAIQVTGVTGNTLTMQRGLMGSTAASHTAGTMILLNPDFFSIEIMDALADGLDAAWPWVYRRISDSSLTIASATIYEYAVPTDSVTGEVFPFIYDIQVKEPGDLTYRPLRRWWILRDAGPLIHFKAQPNPGTNIRILGVARFPRLSFTGSLDTQWPLNLEYPLVEYAGSYLMMGKEIEAQRQGETTTQTPGTTQQVTTTNPEHDTTDTYESGTKETWAASTVQTTTNTGGSDVQTVVRPGQFAATSNIALQRFLRRVQTCGYPPLPRHLVAI